MEDNDIVRIKQRVLRIKGIFKIVLYLGLLFISMLFVFSIFACFSPQEKFNAVKGNNDWNVSYMFINGASFGGTVSFKIMQPLSNIMFSAKTAFITFIFTLLLMKLPVILYAAINLFKVQDSITINETPFNMSNVNRVRKIAYSIILYSLFANLIVNILFDLFVTKIFLINPGNIELEGILVGIVILVISDIFKYGAYLQNEYDTTL